MLSPLGGTVQITCRTQSKYGIQWIVLLQNPENTVVTDIEKELMLLSNYRITPQGLSTPMSVLFIRSRGTEDEIRLTCQAVRSDRRRFSSDIAVVTFFGNTHGSCTRNHTKKLIFFLRSSFTCQ